jgi:hypothetical protein
MRTCDMDGFAAVRAIGPGILPEGDDEVGVLEHGSTGTGPTGRVVV